MCLVGEGDGSARWGWPGKAPVRTDNVGAVMRRMMVMTAGLALAATMGLTGVAGAAPAAPTTHVKPGSMWTNEVTGEGCEIETFGTGHSFTSDLGDAGVYVGGGTKITEVWTAGGADGLVFKGNWVAARGDYAGTFREDGISTPGRLVPGAATFHGSTC